MASKCLSIYSKNLCVPHTISVSARRMYSQNPATVPSQKEGNKPAAQQAQRSNEHPQPRSKPMSIAERDSMLMNAWKEREGSLANAEFEDGKVEEGYRRHVKANIFRYI